MKHFHIYSILNIINGKIYIGKTVNLHKRWRDHISTSKKSSHKDHYLIHRAINKYGKSNFQFSIIQKFNNNEDASLAEKYWIKFYKSYIKRYGDDYGYNLTEGGDGMQLGTSAGENNPRSKLTKNQVIEIKSSNLPTKQLANNYNIHRTIIQRIRNGVIWNHVIVTNSPTKKEISIVFNNKFKARGEDSAKAKLTWDIVKNIREEFKNNKQTIASLARLYNTSWTNIKSIIDYKTWK